MGTRTTIHQHPNRAMSREDLIRHARRNSHLSFEALLATLREENEALSKPRPDHDLVGIASWSVKQPSTRPSAYGVVYGRAQTPEERAAMWKSVGRRKEKELDLFLARHPKGVTVEEVMAGLRVSRPTALKRLKDPGVWRTRDGHRFIYRSIFERHGRHVDVSRFRGQLLSLIGDGKGRAGEIQAESRRMVEPEIDPRQWSTVYLKPDAEIELTVLAEPEDVRYHKRVRQWGRHRSYTYLLCAGEGCAVCYRPAGNETAAMDYKLCKVRTTSGEELWLRYREWRTEPEPTLGRGVWVCEGKGKEAVYGWLGVGDLMRENHWWEKAA